MADKKQAPTTPVEAETLSDDRAPEAEQASVAEPEVSDAERPESIEAESAQEHQEDRAPEVPDAGSDAFVAESAAMVRTEQVIVRQGGFWSMLLGGVVAAGVGVAAAPYVLPPAWFAPEESGVDAALVAQDARLAALRADLDRVQSPPDLSGAVEGLSETLTDLTGQFADLEGRIAALESRPAVQAAGVPVAEIEALRASLAAQAAEVEALRAAADAQEAAARDSAVVTLRRAALTHVRTALDTGSVFAPALSDLRDTGAEVPAALAEQAQTGVPTQIALIETFPEAARAALAAARVESGDAVAGVGGFLKSQLGIRSLSPQEGDDPDAVLSRAEAALAQGRL
ncbi:MAG: COG4223 family protein, partial [Roseovarius sp.]